MLSYINMTGNKVKPRCPYFGSCGGCQLQHLPYEEQLERKRAAVKECMEKEGLGGFEVKPTLGMKDPWFYRNKIQFPIREQNNQLQMGYFRQKTHEVVNIKECHIQDPFLTEIAQISRKLFEGRGLSAYDEKTGKGLLRHFIGRSAQNTDEVLLGIVVNGKGLPAGFTVAHEIKKQERLAIRMAKRHQDYPKIEKKSRIVGIVQNINTERSNVIMGQANTTLLGIPFFRDKLGEFAFNIRLLSFYQVNPQQAERLYNVVRKYAELSGSEVVVDAYAGIGPIAFWLSKYSAQVIGIEESKEAVKDAESNIKLNKIANVRIEQGTIEEKLAKKAEVAILDPPRAGCSEEALKAIVKAAPKKIIYVSCNPMTLARDVKVLGGSGYKLDVIQPVDMFPQTDQVEAVARLRAT